MNVPGAPGGRPGVSRWWPDRRLLTVLLTLVLAVGLAACGGNGDARTATATTAARPRPVYVAVGASETIGIGADRRLVESWPYVLFRTALPADTVYTNLGISGATVETAVTGELPEAARLRPSVVTVWLNVNDLIAGVPPATYERQLRDLVHQLRRGGATKVLVANTPPLDRLPAYTSCRTADRRGCAIPSFVALPDTAALNAGVAAYNAAIGRVTAAEGAVLVDLHATGLAARRDGAESSLVSDDGFHPSTKGHRRVAEAFAAALRRSGGP